MANTETGSLLNKIGLLLATDTTYPLEGTFLYAEVGPDVVSPSIFKGLGAYLLYRFPGEGLTDMLTALWEAEDEDKRWEIVEYLIRAGRFEVRYTYAEEIDRKEEAIDRGQRILKERFHNNRRLSDLGGSTRAAKRTAARPARAGHVPCLGKVTRTPATSP